MGHDGAVAWRVVVMGVAGSGKTTVGALVASALGVPFLDADDLHSPAAKAEMAAGRPLTQAARVPWLDRVHEALAAHDGGVVVACSALTDAARRHLADGLDDVRFVFLTGDPVLLAQRLAGRHGHFAGPNLLPSQLHTLEPPATAITLDVSAPPDVVAARAVAALRS
jgi:gluconokinase